MAERKVVVPPPSRRTIRRLGSRAHKDKKDAEIIQKLKEGQEG